MLLFIHLCNTHLEETNHEATRKVKKTTQLPYSLTEGQKKKKKKKKNKKWQGGTKNRNCFVSVKLQKIISGTWGAVRPILINFFLHM